MSVENSSHLVRVSPDTLVTFFRGFTNDPKILTDTFRELENAVNDLEILIPDIKVMFLRDRASNLLYISPPARVEFVTFFRERFCPLYDKIRHLHQKLEKLLRSPVTVESKKTIAVNNEVLSIKIRELEMAHAEFLKHYNQEITFITYNPAFRNLAKIFFIQPFKASLNFVNFKTGSKIKTLAIVVFGAYSIYNYYTNGLTTTAFHSAAFTGAYILLGRVSQIIRSNI